MRPCYRALLYCMLYAVWYGYSMDNISHRDSSWTPGVFYTYFYNHARRLRLEKLLYLELSISSNGLSKVLLDPGGGFRSETAVTKPFRKWNGYKFITAICNGHYPTDTSVRSDNGYVTAVAVGQSQRLYSGVGIFNWYWYCI